MIEHLDFPKLRALSNSPVSGNTPATESSSYSQFALCLSNLILHTKYMNENDLAMLTMSLQNWMSRRKLQSTTLSVNPGDICLTDLGLVYSPELGFPHPAVILRDMGDYYWVVPATTNPYYLSLAFHPENNPQGDPMLRKVYPTDGFEDTCVLLLTNLKPVGKSRILASGRFKMIDIEKPDSLFNEIDHKCFSHYFAKQYLQLEQAQKRVADLQRELDEINALNAQLLRQIDPGKNDSALA